MLLLTKTNAKQRCRLCLIKIGADEEEENNAIEGTKKVFIYINENSEFELLINKYVTEEKFREHLDQYPQNVCFNCFDKLREVDKFLTEARLNAEALYKLFSESGAEEKLQAGDNDINNILLKDSLMESESILLDSKILSQHCNEEANTLDPFSVNIESIKSDKDLWDNSECSDNDNEWNASSNVSSSSDEIFNRKPTTRSKSKKDSLNSKSNDDDNASFTHLEKESIKIKNPPKRKKRRNKKEMEEFLREKHERMKMNNVKRRQKGTKNNFKCSQCGHRFAHKLTLEAHIRKIHEGQTTRAYHCDRCDKTYSHNTGLFNHIREVHEREGRTFPCDVPNCKRIYNSFLAFQYHKRTAHLDEASKRKYICEQCGATFDLGNKLITHRKHKHPTEAEKLRKKQEGPYECDVCKSLLKSAYTLKYHKLQIHSNELRFECETCHQKFRQRATLEYHRQLKHSTEKLSCQFCERPFLRKYELKKHIRAVHMKLKPYPCKYCTESFASGKTLRHHQYIHTGEKPYVCTFPSCNKAYRQPTCLKNHLKTHEKRTT